MIAALAAWHEQHDLASAALSEVSALPAHVIVETYSVLTRLPGGHAVAPSLAAEALRTRFPGASLGLGRAARDRLLLSLSEAGVLGGSSYDGLVALEASAHGETLLTLDARAQVTYRRLGIAFEMIAS